LDRAALGEYRGQIDIVAVDLEGDLTLAVIDTVHSDADKAVARHLEAGVSLAIELLEEGRAADNDLTFLVVVARHLA